MKKPIALALAAAGLALAFPISAWFLGLRLETNLEEQYRLFNDYPNIKLGQRNFQRGIFSSTETLTLEISSFNELISKYESASNKESYVDPMPPKPLSLTILTRYQHGPFPGFSSLAAATYESELVLDSEQRHALKQLFGDRKPLQAHGIYHFDGSGTATLDSPSFKYQAPDNERDKGLQIIWQGLHMVTTHAAQMQQYSFSIEMPGLEIGDNEGNRLELAGLKLTADERRLFPDDSLFQVGTIRLGLEQLDFHDYRTRSDEKNFAFTLQQLVFESVTPVNGDFIDVIGKAGVQALKFNGQEFGPAHYDFSLRHLHARSAAKLYRAMINSRPTAGKAAPENAEDNSLQTLAKLREPILELLKFSPEIRLDRVSFNTPQGEAKITASASLGEVKAAKFDSPQQLLGKLRATATLTLPENLLDKDITPEQVADLVERGFIQRQGELLHSVISFDKGQITVNDKAFNPQMLTPPSAPPAEADPNAPPAALPPEAAGPGNDASRPARLQ